MTSCGSLAHLTSRRGDAAPHIFAKQAGLAVTLYTFVLKMLGSNLG